METFVEISESAGTDRFSGLTDGSLRPTAVTRAALFGPGRNGWLQACRAWVQDGRTEDPCKAHDCLERIVRGLDEFPGEVAKLHLLATRMACCARRLLQVQEPVGSAERLELRQTLLNCACEALQPDGDQAAASREENHDLGESLAADSPLSLVRKSLTLAADRVGVITPKQAPWTWHLRRIGWLSDLAEYLLGDATKPDRLFACQVESAFVLVPQRQESDAYIAKFVFEAIEGEGTGEVFLAPQQAFVRFGEGFDTVFGETADVVAGLLQRDRKALADVRVRVDAMDSRTRKWAWHGIDQEHIEGPSATGAVVRGLYGAWSRPALVCDPAVICLCAVDRHAKVGAVNDLGRKVQAVVASGLFDTIVVDAGKESVRRIEGQAPGYQVRQADTTEALIGVRSALVEEVVEYLKDLKDQCARLPRYYPERFRKDGSDQGNGFDQVRQTVQVVTDRSRLDQWLAEQREGLRREGLDPDGVFYGPNRGLPDGEGQAEQSKEVETIRWDHRAGRRFRRAIILGDPGFGKTWLLRYEARRLAQEGIDRLLVHQSHSLEQITLPIYVRLSDLAQTSGALKEAMVDQVAGKRSTRFKSLVQDRLGSEKCTILLDAWDEVPNREQLQPRIEKFAKDFGNPQILLTSRIVGYEQTPPPIRDAQELELLAMDWAQVRSFVEVWFEDEARALQFHTKLRNSVQVRGLARIPLMLGLLCKACPEGDFPAKRSELYESCLRGLLRDWHIDDRKPSQGTPIESERSCEYVDALMEVLGEISLRLLDERQEQFSESKLREILERWLKSERCSSEFGGGRASSSELIARFKADGILVKSRSDEESPLIFLHRTFQEYLAARGLARESDWIERALARVYDPGWSQALVLLGGIVPTEQARDYLAAVLAKNGEDLLCRPLLLALELAGQVPREGPGCEAFDLLAQIAVEIVLGRVPLEYLGDPVRQRLASVPEAVGPLKAALKDKDESVREAAAEALGEIGAESAVEALKIALKDKDEYVRRYAAEALGKIRSESAAEALVNIAVNNDENDKIGYVRSAAATALGKIRSESAVEALKTALKDEDRQVREAAAQVLGEIGSESAVEALKAALKNKDRGVRTEAAEALGKIGSESAVEALKTALNDENKWVREAAAEALGKIGSESAVEALKAALKNKDRGVRWPAAQALGRTGSKSAVEALKTALNDEDKWVRGPAAQALGKIGSELAVEALKAALKDKDESVRMYAAEALGKIDSESAVEALDTALNDEDGPVRAEAAEALGKIGSDSAVGVLKAALKDKSRFVRKNAAEALGKIGSESAVEPLKTSLKGKHEFVRFAATKALGEIGSMSAVEPLRTALEDKRESVRAEAAEALGKIGSGSAVEPLKTALLWDTNPRVRGSVAKALGKIGSELAVEALKAALKDKDESVRMYAAEALGKIRSESAVEALTIALNDKDGSVCVNAAEALGRIGSEAAVEALKTALNDKYWSVRRSAAEALGRIGSESAVGALKAALKYKDRIARQAAGYVLRQIMSAQAVKPEPAHRQLSQLQIRLGTVRSLVLAADSKGLRRRRRPPRSGL